MSEATRLKNLINQLNINASQFAKQAGIKQPTISAVMAGRKRITIDMVHSIRDSFPQVNLDWLLKGRGEMLIEEENQSSTTILNDTAGELDNSKSPIGIHEDSLPDEETMKVILSDNLRTVAKRWGITQPEMSDFLGGDVGRQGASSYFKGNTLPRLPQLLRLERFSGWPLVILSTIVLEPEQIPLSPLVDAPILPSPLSNAESQELKDELHRLRLRLGRIIDKMEKP